MIESTSSDAVVHSIQLQSHNKIIVIFFHRDRFSERPNKMEKKVQQQYEAPSGGVERAAGA
jgi:hypothetical protein